MTRNFIPTGNRVLGASPPDISPLECLLPRSVHNTLAQLRCGHCRLLNTYKARITSGISDVCPECGVALDSVEHLFNCQSHPTQLTVQDLWDNPCSCRLRQPGKLMIRDSWWAVTTTTRNFNGTAMRCTQYGIQSPPRGQRMSCCTK